MKRAHGERRERASSQVDSPTFGDNMWRCFHCLRRCLRQNLLLVRPGPLVGARAFVGKTGWRGPAGLGPPRVHISMAGGSPFFLNPPPPPGMSTKKAFFFKKTKLSLKEIL